VKADGRNPASACSGFFFGFTQRSARLMLGRDEPEELAARALPGQVTFSAARPRGPSGMNPFKSLWASVQGSPVFMRRVNGWMTVLWIAMIPTAYALGWLKSVTFVSALSLWALVTGHWSTWQAARVEVTQREEAEERERHPVEDRIVKKLVVDTDLESS
jgi:hypothetical protein